MKTDTCAVCTASAAVKTFVSPSFTSKRCLLSQIQRPTSSPTLSANAGSSSVVTTTLVQVMLISAHGNP